jgi:hypothetical protein
MANNTLMEVNFTIGPYITKIYAMFLLHNL